MPTFGDYESVGEPVATRDERGHISTVWHARKIEARDSQLFVVKFYAPHRRETKEGASGDVLATDRGLGFLEGVKQLKQAGQAAGSCLAPIHDFGTTEGGVWYVTDLYRRGSLKAWIARKGGVDSSTLRHVIYCVATGCLALKRLCGRSHGNLQAGNVFMVGKRRPLRNTPLVLADPYPASGAQILRLDATDRRTAGDLLHQVVEAHDLHDIGELIFQLVEGRLVLSKYDYNYPIESSSAWENLGKDGERWRQLCNQLLDPRLSLAEVNLESLAKEFRPNRVIANLRLIAAVVGGISLLALGGTYAYKVFAKGAEQRKLTPANEAKANEQNYLLAMSEGKSALEAKDYAKARTNAAVALGIRPKDAEATKLRDDAQAELDLAIANDQKYQSAMKDGNAAFGAKDYAKARTGAEAALAVRPKDPKATKLRDDAQGQLDLAMTNDQKYQSAMKDGNAAFGAKDYAKARTGAEAALAVRPKDPKATKLRDDAQGQLDLAMTNDQKYQSAMKEGNAAFDAKDYAKARTGAEAALAIRPKDLEATRLRDDAQSQLNLLMANDQKYQSAIKEGKAAFDAKDYTKARTGADAALAIRPKDLEATKLRDDAQDQLDLVMANDQKYQSAIKEGKAAFDAKDYTKARTGADAALAIRPKDLEATKLRDDAQGQLDLAMASDQKYRTAMQEGKDAFDAKEYARARTQAEMALMVRPQDPEAARLRDDAQSRLDLADGANNSNPALVAADTTLEVYEVWFGIRSNKDPKLVYDKARQERKSQNTRPSSPLIDSLEKAYRGIGAIDDQRKARLEAVREKINSLNR